jgi:hypothetical protein
MDSEVAKSLTIIGTAIGAGGVGALGAFVSQRRQLKKYKSAPDRRQESTETIVRKTVEATRKAVEDSMTAHIGDGNGHIKDSIARIETYIALHPQICTEKHKGVDQRLETLEKRLP